MPAVTNSEWLNQNSLRAYPFREDMQRLPGDQAGNLIADAQLPNYVVVDLVLSMPTPGTQQLFLSQLALVGNLLTFMFSETDQQTIVCSATVDLTTHQTYQAYQMVGSGGWADARGQLVVGDMTNLERDLAPGLYNYTAQQTLLEATTVRPTIRGVRSLQVQNQANLSDKLYGHVRLVAGQDILLVHDTVNNAIIVNVIPGAGQAFQEDCGCTSTQQTNVVRTINGIALENVEIVGSDCLKVTTSGNTITLEDVCSKPCCGCEELQFLTDSLKVIDATLARLEEFSQRLNERITTFVTNFVIS